MPPVGSASGDDLASSDEIKVFKDEGGEEKRASAENLTDLKSSLISEGETQPLFRHANNKDKIKPFVDPIAHSSFGYPLSAYHHPHPHPHHPHPHHPHTNGALASVSMVSCVWLVPRMASHLKLDFIYLFWRSL